MRKPNGGDGKIAMDVCDVYPRLVRQVSMKAVRSEAFPGRKYNSGDCLLEQAVKLTPLVFTPGGHIG